MGDQNDSAYYFDITNSITNSINNLVASHPDITAELRVLWEQNEQFKGFFNRIVLAERAKVEAIVEEKLRLDADLMASVQALSMSEGVIKPLSKTAILDVKAYIKQVSTINVDGVNERKATDLMTTFQSQHMTTERLNRSLQKRESNIAAAEHNIKQASAKLPTLVLEKWVLLKLKTHLVKKEQQAEKAIAEKANRLRQMENLKQQEVSLFSSLESF
jgi:hypothetical protein